MELIDDSPKMELIDDSIPSSSKKEEPSKTSIIDTVKKAVTTPLSHIKQATDVALPAAENLTSQVLGIGGFAASVPVAVRDYMQALFESGGDWDKAYEAGSKGVQEVNDIVGSWKPRTELGKKSIEYSNKVVGGIMEPIASTVGKEASHQAQSWGAPEGIQKTLKAVGETATEAEIFRRSLKGRVPSRGEVLDTIDATLGRGDKAPIIQEVLEGNKWKATRRPGQQAMEERLKDIQPEEVFEPVTIRPNNVVSPKRKMEIIDDSSISNKEVPIDNTLSSKIEQRPYVSGDTFSYRGKPYIVESIDGETGRIKAFGREKTIDPVRVKDQGASPHPIDEVRNTYDTLYRAGYQESELMHMPFEEMKRLISERDSSMKRTPTLEEINKQKAITDSILEGQRAKDIADIQLLKEYGYDEGRISEMHDRDIKRTANDIRDYIRDKETGTSKADRAEASIDEFDTILETLKDKKVEDYTPEDMELIRKALGDTEGYVDDSSVKGLGEEYREFLRQQETGMTDADIEAWENASTNKAVEQAASLGDKVALEVKGKREVSTYGERLDLIKEENKRLIQEGKVKTHRPGKRRPVEEQSLEELMEGDGELPPEELNFMMSSKVYDDLPSYLRDPNTAIGPIERMIERSRQAASELYTHIAQGLASENISIRNQAERGQAFLQGKMDFIDTMREVAQDKPWTTVESMNSLVRGYRYLPSMFDKTLSKESFIKSIRKLEEKAGVDEKVHRTGPNVHEAIDDYFKKGDISSTEATWLHAVVDALKGKAKFDLLLGDRLLKNKKANGRFYDKDGNQVALGYYDFVNNILAIKDKASFLHEVSHFAFYNVLSSADRINFLKSLTEQFYKDGKLDRSALRDHLETDHFYEMINPSEIFAKEMQNYVLQKAKSSWVKDTYEKVKSFVRSMIGEAERSGAIPIERRAIYDSVLFDMKAGETGRLGRRYIPGRVIEGYGEISPMFKRDQGNRTLDFMGLQQIYEGAVNAYKALRSKEQNPIVKICEQIGRGKEETNRIKLGMPDKKNGGTKVEPFSDDIWIGTQWNPLRQPLGEMRLDGKKQRFLKGWADGTPVEGTVYEANKGQNAASFYHNNNVIGLRETQMFLKRNGISNEDLTAYMRGEYTGKVSQAMLEGAGKVRDWLDYMRDRYRDFLKGEYARHLKNKELGALNDLINGKNLLEVSKRWRIKNLDVIKDIYDDYKKLENWGLDDYLPKVELGSYRIVTPEGTVVGVALSRKHAVQKIMEIIDEYPEYKGDFYIDNTPRSAMFENLTGVGSTKAYYSIVHKLAKAIQEESSGIDSAIAEKMAQRSVKKQFSIKPVDKYSEFTKVREDYLRGEKDIFPVLAKYSRVMELKMALDPVIHEYKKNVRDKLSLAPNLREATDRLLEDAKGKYWKIDQAIDFLLKKPYEYLEKKGVDVGPAPIMSFSRWTGRARAFEANVKLGYRPVNSVVNFVSGQGHVWTKTGTEYIGKAWKLRNSAEGKALLDELGPYMGMAFAEEGVGTGAFSIRKAGETKIGAAMKPLGAFQAAEIPNREIGILANYLMGKEKFGLSESAAKEFAIRSNWFQNFSYNIANLPASMRGPLGKTVGQFKTYMFKEMSFIASLTPQELARYSTMQLMLGGPRALMYVIKSLPIVAIVNSAEDIERWLNTNYPRVSRGIPGFFGTDISAMSSFQLPTEPSELVGPLFSDIWNMYKTFAVPVMNGTQNVQQTATLDNVNSLLMDNVPFWRNWNDVWKNGLTGDGNLKDVKTGKIMTDNPLWLNTDDYMKKVLATTVYSAKRVIGAQDLEVSATRLEESLDKREEKRLSEALLIVNRQIAEIVAEGKPVPQYLWDRKTELMLKGKDMTMRGLEQTLENQVLPPTVRRLRRKNQIQKADVLEHAPDFD